VGYPIDALRMRNPAAAGHTHWRLFMTNNYGGAGFTLGEIEMRGVVGGPDLCTGGTPTVSDTSAGNAAADMFDNSIANFNYWDAASTNQWAAYQFPSPVDIVEIAIAQTGSATDPLGRAPKDCIVQYSDDGVSWSDAFSFTFAAFVVDAFRAYPEAPPAAGYHRAWRLLAATVNGAAFTEIREIELRATPGGADQSVAVAAGAGSSLGRIINSNTVAGGDQTGAWNDTTAIWRATGGTNQWTGFVFPNPVKVEELVLTAGTNVTQAPRTFSLQYSDDLVTWTTQMSFGPFSWTSGQSRTLAAI
jgi:hypothetical protein